VWGGVCNVAGLSDWREGVYLFGSAVTDWAGVATVSLTAFWGGQAGRKLGELVEGSLRVFDDLSGKNGGVREI
jgi:hypothetical protein